MCHRMFISAKFHDSLALNIRHWSAPDCMILSQGISYNIAGGVDITSSLGINTTYRKAGSPYNGTAPFCEELFEVLTSCT